MAFLRGGPRGVMMIQITDTIAIDENEIELVFVRASGPGGQKVNKTSTAVQLFFDAAHSPSLPEEVRARLAHTAGNKINKDGVLVIDARRFRTQERNREDALERLVALLREASKQPKRRRKSKPSAQARERRLAAKRHRSEVKRYRQRPSRHDEGS